MIYPRLSPNGHDVVGGNQFIQLNNVEIPPITGDSRAYGTSPVWALPNLIYYTYSRPSHPSDGKLVEYRVGQLPVLTGTLSGNVLTAGGGIHAIWRPNHGVQVMNEPNHPTWHSPSLSDTGQLAHGFNNDDTRNYAWSASTIAREYSTGMQLLYDVNNPSLSWIPFNPEPKCGKPIPIWTGRLLFVLFHTNDGCVFLMEAGSRLGYLIKERGWDGGSGYTHDARMYDPNRIRVISPGFDILVNINAERIPLPPSNGTNPIPPNGGDDMNENYSPVPTSDQELSQLAERLENKYHSPAESGGLGRGPTETFVDQLGASRWRRDYFIYRDKGSSPDDAWHKVNKAINDITGLTGDPNFP